MGKEQFDFGSLLNEQFKGIRHGYKFGKAFNEDKSIVGSLAGAFGKLGL